MSFQRKIVTPAKAGAGIQIPGNSAHDQHLTKHYRFVLSLLFSTTEFLPLILFLTLGFLDF